MAWSRANEETYLSRKSVGPRKLVTAGRKYETIWESTNGATDISCLKSLEGREIKVKVVTDMKSEIEKVGVIKAVYPHHVSVEYIAGKDDHPKYKLLTSLNTADLVTKGIIQFTKGHPEVVDQRKII